MIARRVVLVLLVAAAIWIAPMSAGAATKTIGDLVYADPTTGDLMLVHADGSPTQRLTTSGDASDPSFSPDGRTIAFDRGGDIWLLRAGAAAVRITFTGGATDPAWSPDGTTIAYTQRVSGGLSDIYLVESASGHARRLSKAANLGCSASQPTWQARGGQVAYVRTGACAQGIVLQRPGASGRLVVADPTARQPAFTIDGKHLLYVADCPPGDCITRFVWKASPTGAHQRMVASDADCTDSEPCLTAMVRSPVVGWVEAATTSPDGGATTLTCFTGHRAAANGSVSDTAPDVCVGVYVDSFDVRLG